MKPKCRECGKTISGRGTTGLCHRCSSVANGRHAKPIRNLRKDPAPNAGLPPLPPRNILLRPLRLPPMVNIKDGEG